MTKRPKFEQLEARIRAAAPKHDADLIVGLLMRIKELERYEPQSIHVRSAYCDCCAAPVPFDHICSCELEQA